MDKQQLYRDFEIIALEILEIMKDSGVRGAIVTFYSHQSIQKEFESRGITHDSIEKFLYMVMAKMELMGYISSLGNYITTTDPEVFHAIPYFITDKGKILLKNPSNRPISLEFIPISLELI